MKTILVADDSLASRELLREVLEAAGYRVLEAANGIEALDMIRRNEPDLAFLDIRMPGMDGIGVVHELRKDIRFEALPVIAVTAYAMPGDRERVVEAGFDSYITKPIDVDDLQKQVQALFDRG
jgi:CheY-like chemotaxis protein